MVTALAMQNGTPGGALVEQVVIQGDLSNLSSEQRAAYYQRVCESLGLNPYTKPFAYIVLNEKLTLYALRDATDQLRKLHQVSVKIVSREVVEGVYVVQAQATMPNGRSDEAIGAVPLVKENGQWKQAQSGKRYFEADGTFATLRPEDRANALMKAETKAKRRVTLSICGLGWLDESEVEGIPGAVRVEVDQAPREPLPALEAIPEETRQGPAGPAAGGRPHIPPVGDEPAPAARGHQPAPDTAEAVEAVFDAPPTGNGGEPVIDWMVEAQALYEQAKALGINRPPPHPASTDMGCQSYIAATKRAINAKQGSR